MIGLDFKLLVLCATLSFITPIWAEISSSDVMNLSITRNATVTIPPTLYGYMFEDINHSGDGGLYAELLQNRAFQAVVPETQSALTGWQPSGGALLSVTNNTGGISDALTNSLKVQIPENSTGPVGFENTGYWGIRIEEGWTYTGSFYAKSDNSVGTITVSLKSVNGTTFTSKQVSGISRDWNKFTFTFQPNASAPDVDNVFSVAVDGRHTAGQTIYFGMFSLFPPTFKGRENGLRIDMAEALAATKPSIWRFPGGNNLEGNSIATRWKWNETIGPLENRPGRMGTWGYVNTDGLGLLEYLDWIEDIGAEPILGVWDGIALGADFSDYASWPIVPEADLQPYVDDVINEIEFITADAKTNKWGQLRASYGREEPYSLTFIEIGNEDQFQPQSYAGYRWNAFVTQLGAKFPNLQFLATSYPDVALNPPYKKIDLHQYNAPDWFTSNAFYFDTYPRNGTQYFVGEYAVTSTNDSDTLGAVGTGRLAYPTLQGSAAEAAFLTGLERNSDVVFASSYAPSLQHIEDYQWTPNIMTFDAGRMVNSTSYYVQQLFSLNRGTHVLATAPTSTMDSYPLFWVASHNDETDTVFLKVSNVGQDDLVVSFSLEFEVISRSGKATTLSTPVSGVFNISNTLDEPNLIKPVTSSFVFPQNDRFNYTFPATSVTVLALAVDAW